jgi:hypothetical protein
MYDVHQTGKHEVFAPFREMLKGEMYGKRRREETERERKTSFVLRVVSSVFVNKAKLNF